MRLARTYLIDYVLAMAVDTLKQLVAQAIENHNIADFQAIMSGAIAADVRPLCLAALKDTGGWLALKDM